jgi:hypothetical protein
VNEKAHKNKIKEEKLLFVIDSRRRAGKREMEKLT